MFKRLNKEDVPVLYQINGLLEVGYKHFKLDNADYSLFLYEQEILLIAGSEFEILEISEEEHQSRKY